MDWFRTVLVGILKRGKDAKNPIEYRIIGLGSCLLKVCTMESSDSWMPMCAVFTLIMVIDLQIHE